MIIRFGNKAIRPTRIRLKDWLLILGLTMAPMTALRIWKVGPAEVLCLLWGLLALKGAHLSASDLSRFFFGFIVALLLGSAFGYFIAPSQLSLPGIAVWLYLGTIAVLTYEGLRKYPYSYNEKLLTALAFFSLFWYLLLYIYSKTVSTTLLGVSLWYSSRRFSGGGLNPHQVGVFFTGMSFVFLRKVLKRELPLLCTFGFLANLFLLWETESTTGEAAVVIGIFIALYFGLSEAYPRQKGIIFVVLAGLAVVVGVVGFRIWMRLFMNWLADDSNGMGRLEIFASFPETFLKSPLFGLGPGTHAKNGAIEFHNTYLEILAASGLVGGIIFVVFTVRLVRKVIKADWRLLPIIVALYAFGLAGFAMRRLIYWGLTAFVLTLAEQIRAEMNQNT